jgi:thymidylate kinase
MGKICVYPEPVQDWEELLEKFYSNENLWVTSLQMRILYSQIRIYQEIKEKFDNLDYKHITIEGNIGSGKSTQINRIIRHYSDKNFKTNIVITERSPNTSQKVFTQILLETNKIHPMAHKILNDFQNLHTWDTDYSIYLSIKPDTCLKRIIMRSRKGENKISLEYLEKLHEKHEKLYNNSRHLIIDSSRSEDEIFKDIIKEIDRYTD